MTSSHFFHFEKNYSKLHFIATLLFLFAIPFLSSAVFAQSVNIAVIETKGTGNKLSKIFEREIKALFEGKQDVNFINYFLSKYDDADLATTVFDEVSSNDKVDIILVLDLAANQKLGHLNSFPKPTFLPFVINAQLSGLSILQNRSSKNNLNFITTNFNFERELKTFQSVTPFDNAVLISDTRFAENINPKIIQEVAAQAKKVGVVLTIHTFNGDIRDLTLPEKTNAVLYGFMADIEPAKTKLLFDWINKQGLPGFSLVGEDHVKLGALASNRPTTDIEKLARRISLHIEEVVLGQPASNLPVILENSDSLTINMATSRQIRIAPGFLALSNAKLINEIVNSEDRRYSLTEVARKAIRENLSIAAQRLQVESANQSIKEARGGLLPQIRSSVEYLARKDSTNAVRSGSFAESTTDGSITLTQPLFVEEKWARYSIEKYLALSERERLREVELDIIQAAVTTYLNVLFEKTSLEQERYNLNVTQENYRLAKNRVDIGTQTAADLYRWENELANAKQAVLQADSRYKQQRQTLNQLLNRPIAENFSTTVETLENPDLLISDERITALIKNSYSLDILTNYFVEIGLSRAPEIKQVEATISANERQLKSDRRSFWVPDINLTTELTSNFDEKRVAGGIEAEDDWFVGIEFSLPLYEGGSRSARLSQSHLAVRQLKLNLVDQRTQIEQDIRNNLEVLNVSYNSIPLAKLAEIAAQKNYDLINNSYKQGALSITDVLDAQDALITAREASTNTTYAFLIDLMNVQRSIGAFDFFLTDKQRMDFSDTLIDRLNKNSSQ